MKELPRGEDIDGGPEKLASPGTTSEAVSQPTAITTSLNQREVDDSSPLSPSDRIQSSPPIFPAPCSLPERALGAKESSAEQYHHGSSVMDRISAAVARLDPENREAIVRVLTGEIPPNEPVAALRQLRGHTPGAPIKRVH